MHQMELRLAQLQVQLNSTSQTAQDLGGVKSYPVCEPKLLMITVYVCACAVLFSLLVWGICWWYAWNILQMLE